MLLHSVYRGVQLVIGRLCRDNIVDFNDGSTCAKFSVYKHIPGTIHLSLESGLQRYGTLFFCQKNGKQPCGNKKLQSYRVTELQSISPGNEDNFIFLQKKMKKSYRVTELQSYRPQFFSSGNQVTKLQQKLQSYVTS